MANETQHTPAPWSVHTSFDNIEIHQMSDEDGEFSIADIPTDSGFSKEVREANAQLIAKAPELLKENEQLKKDLEKERLQCMSADVAIEFVVEEKKKERKAWEEETKKLKALNAELLEALKVAQKYVNAYDELKGVHPSVKINIQSAIAKAEGK